MKICILTIATNKYLQFVEKLYEDLSEKFCPGRKAMGVGASATAAVAASKDAVL